ncbi:DoxX family protein [Mycobacterium sp. 663a-19]|uniref:DoxX family protein n=1 Tax=Mycobacterium sp. 663a-19 TaxID=2986148 RepID=UPI002D1E7F30|nr:DoxX family protein [Mycobacterium sp. 663a-19]MEB3984036.1 DoxX family protein [Mycobacterium sp. 663a-19]
MTPARIRAAAYWTTTALLTAECFVGGVLGAFRLQPFNRVMTHLGYPPYFMTILGVCYVSAGVALLAPRLALVKEWAYAGLMFVYAGAIASHIWVGDGATTLVGPLVFAGLAVASWALRPQSRRVERPVR